MEDKRLFLLDGMALVFRAYFAFSQNPRITSYGMNTSAIFGYTNTVLDIIKKEKPTHIGVAFDTAAPTARHEAYEQYKAHRDETPEDIIKAIPYIIQITKALRIPVLIKDGYEADDIIGTLAKKAEKQGYTTYMMTPDKDFGQLVSDHIFIYKPARLGNDIEIMGVPEVLKKWEISRVDQVIDILGLWGDAVDNIPGVPGVGEKTAKLLVQKYGSMEGLYAHTHELKGKQKENVENNREQAFLSKQLATIDTQVPIDLEEDHLLLEEPDFPEVEKLFTELEFRTLARRVLPGSYALSASDPVSSQTAAKTDSTTKPKAQVPDLFNQVVPDETPLPTAEFTIHNTPHTYVLCDTEEKQTHLLKTILESSDVCFDTETTGLDTLQAELVGMSFSVREYEAFYVPLPADRATCLTILNRFTPFFQNNRIRKIGQNLKYDISVLMNYGILLSPPYFDTMIANYIINPDEGSSDASTVDKRRGSMDKMALNYLKYEPVHIESLIGKKARGKEQLSMRDVPLEQICEYAAEDADITLRLKNYLEPRVISDELNALMHDLEMPLIPVLSKMEREGVRINESFLHEYSQQLATEIRAQENRIYELAGTTFNVASPRQLGDILFDHLKLDPKAKKTKTGQYQTGEEVLSKLTEHEIVRCILDIRELQKLRSTYVETLPQLVNSKTGRVHTSFNQAVAATGRLSSTNPNLQNIPVRTDRGREIRKAFIPRNDSFTLLSADYSQIELRIIASMAKETNMMEAFRAGLDIHAATASKVYHKSLDEVTSDERRNAKAVNFGIIYGQSAFGLAQNLGIPRKEAAEIIDEYFRQYPNIKTYMNESIHFAHEHGFVKTLGGRKRYLRDIHSANHTVRSFAERNAINAPIQGSAADMIKLAMIRIDHRLQQEHPTCQSRMILQVHDELLFDAHVDEVEWLTALVKEEMEAALPLDIPVLAEAGTGANWLEAH